MIKRIVFFLAILFMIFGIVYLVNKQKAIDFVQTVKNGDVGSGVQLTFKDDDGSDDNNSDEQDNSENATDTEKTNTDTETSGDEVTSSQPKSLVIDDDVKDVIAKELGLDNFDGDIILVDNQGKELTMTNDTKTTTTSNTTTKSSTTSSTSSTKKGLTQDDLDMIARLAGNIDNN